MTTQKFQAMRTTCTIILALFIFTLSSSIEAQDRGVGKQNVWTFGKVSSREKYDEVLPVTYKMRTSKNKGFDRIVFEFDENDVPEYEVYYTKPPIFIDPSHIENPAKPTADEIVKVKGKAFIIVDFALSFQGKDVRSEFMGEQDMPVLRDIKTVDWFENFFSFAVGLKARKTFRVQELSNPTRLVIDFKH